MSLRTGWQGCIPRRHSPTCDLAFEPPKPLLRLPTGLWHTTIQRLDLSQGKLMTNTNTNQDKVSPANLARRARTRTKCAPMASSLQQPPTPNPTRKSPLRPRTMRRELPDVDRGQHAARRKTGRMPRFSLLSSPVRDRRPVAFVSLVQWAPKPPLGVQRIGCALSSGIHSCLVHERNCILPVHSTNSRSSCPEPPCSSHRELNPCSRSTQVPTSLGFSSSVNLIRRRMHFLAACAMKAVFPRRD